MALWRGYLYVIADVGRQFAKIGMARDIHSRFEAIKPSCPLKLEIISTYPCTYAKSREFLVHKALTDLCLHHEWFKWDAPRIQQAIEQALAISDKDLITPPKRNYNYPVRRTDTGEVFENPKTAALIVLGSKKLANKIRKAVRDGVKCGPSTWTRV